MTGRGEGVCHGGLSKAVGVCQLEATRQKTLSPPAPFTDQQANPQNDFSVGGQSWEQTDPIYSLQLLKLPLSYVINSRHFSQRNFIYPLLFKLNEQSTPNIIAPKEFYLVWIIK